MRLTKEAATEAIKQNWAEILPQITPGAAKKKVNGEASYICPLCGHGKGGDGLTFNPQSEANGLKCFGCNFTGDIIDLYQQAKGKEFPEAVNDLAQLIGIEIDGTQGASEARTSDYKSKTAGSTTKTKNGAQSRTEDAEKTFWKLPTQGAVKAEEPEPIKDGQREYIKAVFRPGEPIILKSNLSSKPDPVKYEDLLQQEPDENMYRDGMFVVVNPATSAKDIDVKEYRHALIEWDGIHSEEQKAFYWKDGEPWTMSRKQQYTLGRTVLQLPAVAITDSGGKSVHFVVKVDAGQDRALYDERVKELQRLSNIASKAYFSITCESHGITCEACEKWHAEDPRKREKACTVDPANRNPARCTRAAGYYRGDKLQNLIYVNEYPRKWDKWYDWAEDQTRKEDFLGDFMRKIQTDAYKPINTGAAYLDKITGGIINQTLVMLMASPGAGKTTLCQQWAEEMASAGKPVIYLNYEMSRDQMTAKAISYHCAKSGYHREGRFLAATDILQGYRWTEKQRTVITSQIEKYKAGAAKYIEYKPDYVTADIENILSYLDRKAEKAAKRGRPAPVVFVDYLHLVSTEDKRIDEKEKIKTIMLQLKDWAMKYDTVVFLIGAVNRESMRSGKISLSSGRDSSNIEYSADYVLSLNFKCAEEDKDIDDYLDSLNPGEPREMVLRVHKSRMAAGAKRRAILDFYAEQNLFKEAEQIPTKEITII